MEDDELGSSSAPPQWGSHYGSHAEVQARRISSWAHSQQKSVSKERILEIIENLFHVNEAGLKDAVARRVGWTTRRGFDSAWSYQRKQNSEFHVTDREREAVRKYLATQRKLLKRSIEEKRKENELFQKEFREFKSEAVTEDINEEQRLKALLTAIFYTMFQTEEDRKLYLVEWFGVTEETMPQLTVEDWLAIFAHMFRDDADLFLAEVEALGDENQWQEINRGDLRTIQERINQYAAQYAAQYAEEQSKDIDMYERYKNLPINAQERHQAIQNIAIQRAQSKYAQLFGKLGQVATKVGEIEVKIRQGMYDQNYVNFLQEVEDATLNVINNQLEELVRALLRLETQEK